MVAGEKTRPASSGANRSILIVEHEKGQKEACCLAAYLPNSPKAHDQCNLAMLAQWKKISIKNTYLGR